MNDLYFVLFLSYTLTAGIGFALGYSLKQVRRKKEPEISPEEYGRKQAREAWEHHKKQKRFEAAYEAELKLLQADKN